MGDFVGTNSTQHRCKCMRVDEYVHVCAGLRECQLRHFPACCLMVNGRNNTRRLMVVELGIPPHADSGNLRHKVYNDNNIMLQASSGDTVACTWPSLRGSLRGWTCGSRPSRPPNIPRSSSCTLPSVGCLVTMAPLLLEVPWDAEGTIPAHHVT